MTAITLAAAANNITAAADRLNTDDVAAMVGATYRQVDYWTRLGVLRPTQAYRGSGTPRVWSPLDLRVAAVVAQLRRLGAEVDTIREAAAWLYDNLDRVTGGWIILTPLRLFPTPTVEHVDDLAHAETHVGGGAWVVPIPEPIG